MLSQEAPHLPGDSPRWPATVSDSASSADLATAPATLLPWPQPLRDSYCVDPPVNWFQEESQSMLEEQMELSEVIRKGREAQVARGDDGSYSQGAH